MSTPVDVELSLSEIARLANVSVAAASNWRARHNTFPEPVGDAGAGPARFRLSEINAWLRSTGRDPVALQPQSVADRWWHVLSAGRGRYQTPELVMIACQAIALRIRLSELPDLEYRLADVRRLPYPAGLVTELVRAVGLEAFDAAFDALKAAANEMPDLVASFDELDLDVEHAADTVDHLLDRLADQDRFSMATGPSLRALISAIAPTARRVYDPAAGTGGLLLTVVGELNARGDEHPVVYAQEINQLAWSCLVSRAIAHGSDPHGLSLGDSMLDDRFPELRADLIVSDPPYNQQRWGAERLLADPRFCYAAPNDRDANAAWLQHVLWHLAEHGTALVVIPPGFALSSGRNADLRRNLVAEGAVEAVIALPARLAASTVIPLTIWVLRKPGSNDLGRRVLFIDATNKDLLGPKRRGARELTGSAFRDIVDAVQRFRDDPFAATPTSGFSTAVEVSRLLTDSKVSLAPQHWVEVPGADPDELAADLHTALRAVHVGAATLSQLPPVALRLEDAGSPTAVQIDALARVGAIGVLRSGRVKPEEHTESGVPVLTQSSLDRDGGPPRIDRWVSEQTAQRQTVTQPGDIIYAGLGERPFAVVDRSGGHVVSGNLELLRVDPDRFDPEVIAALITSAASAAPSTGASIPRTRLRDLAIPQLDAETTVLLRDALSRLAATTRAAAQLASSAQDARALIASAAAAGHRFGSHEPSYEGRDR